MLFLLPFSTYIEMESMNLIKACFALLIFLMVLLSVLVNICERNLPDFVSNAFRYGKFAHNGKSSQIPMIEVPKSWFRHFYVYSSILTSTALFWLGINTVFGINFPEWFLQLTDLVAGKQREQNVSTTNTLLAMLLLTIQCCRRFYDTQFISVFGDNCKMNISHYIVGLSHYSGAVAAILAEVQLASFSKAGISFGDISKVQWMASVLFLWAWYQQFKATVILANLRKNTKGSVVSQKHKIPFGGLFEYVSSPHMLAEILMYFALTIVLWGNSTWLYVFIWVTCNQAETCLLSHWWYLERFADYPKSRKAIIPYVY